MEKASEIRFRLFELELLMKCLFAAHLLPLFECAFIWWANKSVSCAVLWIFSMYIYEHPPYRNSLPCCSVRKLYFSARKIDFELCIVHSCLHNYETISLREMREGTRCLNTVKTDQEKTIILSWREL